MQEAIQPITLSEAANSLAATAYRAETWAGEPFLYDGEDVEKARGVEMEKGVGELVTA
jgi:hypothetical protein